ncbi:MAG: hypothetical protein IJH07_01370 [Ruminococcus sp.]|nr:hypothetical protein [Ruminococcus sp.]
MKKAIKWIYIIYQGVLIASTLINVFYWFCVKKTFFVTSIILVFVPLEKFTYTHGIFQLILACIYFVLTVYSYIKMIPELLYSEKVRLPYTIANLFWLCVSEVFTEIFGLSAGNSFIEKIADSDFSLLFVLLLTIFVAFILVVALWGVRREEKFRLRATGYEQILRTAKGSLVFVSACTLLCFVLWSLEYPSSQFQYILYAFCLFVLIINLIATITESKKLAKREDVTDGQKKKLNVIQSISFVALVVSFLCMQLLDRFVKI